jgi:enamine deaminase RidA (YjgF/YER057c/UK114 family)
MKSGIASPILRRVGCPELPSWVVRWVGRPLQAGRHGTPDGRTNLQWSVGESAGLITATVVNAAGLNAEEFKRQVRWAYVEIERRSWRLDRPWVWRYWNFIPDIHRRGSDGCDRYMVFNAGRYEAIETLGAGANPARCAASALGWTGSDLVIAALAGRDSTSPADNPRQIPAVRYSPRYGPLPPAFARGTVMTIGGERRLIGAGTASVVGEESCHAGDLEAQLEETLRNVAALIESAGGERSLRACREMRLYLRRIEDEAAAVERVLRAAANLRELEIVRADVCRRELLVEIEPLAMW